MGNVSTFLKLNGNKKFSELPFCDADLLVLCILSYADFEESDVCKDLDMEKTVLSIRKFNTQITFEFLTEHYLFPQKFRIFYKSFLSCKRYKHLKLGHFRNVFDENVDVQFFGLSFFLDDKIFICFRGTDRSIVGWKEDFNMALVKDVPSQLEAKNYLEKMVNYLNKDVYIIGHSKGGNLAYYSFFNADKKIQDHVLKVFNLDGPGFKHLFIEDYVQYKDKIVKIVPNDDVVGVLLEPNSDFVIVRSNTLSVLAHDLFTWQLKFSDGFKSFVTTKYLTIYSEALKVSLAEFIEKIGVDEVKDICDFIFEIIDINKVTDARVVMKEALLIYKRYLDKNKDKDKQTIARMNKNLMLFIKTYLHTLFTLRRKDRDEIVLADYKEISEGEI